MIKRIEVRKFVARDRFEKSCPACGGPGKFAVNWWEQTLVIDIGRLNLTVNFPRYRLPEEKFFWYQDLNKVRKRTGHGMPF
ncbi:hypothetical protein SEA_JUMBO_72 [Gordonia phage Jumbo]|uniref:Uncharacterized protein n=1 Tax=Gordonia phage Jumbo TaxID=1887650 RepID=A0A1B3B0M3_9CAUD|nr:hypothetical protein BIZ69_gp072 [Gordonia phage Jumbo]AOE44580.1 hypothetical protein SEA_JUMBO_72 [Gordonia phage Jumbo]